MNDRDPVEPTSELYRLMPPSASRRPPQRSQVREALDAVAASGGVRDALDATAGTTPQPGPDVVVPGRAGPRLPHLARVISSRLAAALRHPLVASAIGGLIAAVAAGLILAAISR